MKFWIEVIKEFLKLKRNEFSEWWRLYGKDNVIGFIAAIIICIGLVVIFFIVFIVFSYIICIVLWLATSFPEISFPFNPIKFIKNTDLWVGLGFVSIVFLILNIGFSILTVLSLSRFKDFLLDNWHQALKNVSRRVKARERRASKKKTKKAVKKK